MFRKIWRLVKRKVRRRRKPFIQGHHISYDPEIVVKIWVGEHWILTQLQRRTKRVSVGFIVSLKTWLKDNEKRAIDWSRKKQDTKLLEEMRL